MVLKTLTIQCKIVLRRYLTSKRQSQFNRYPDISSTIHYHHLAASNQCPSSRLIMSLPPHPLFKTTFQGYSVTIPPFSFQAALALVLLNP